jgi:hypothetical protein
MLALSRGSARLAVDLAGDAVHIESPAGEAAEPRRELGAEFGVDIVVDQATAPVMLDFDGLGVGRLANRTFRIRRGAAEARLTLSTYGRPRRW